jgi:hypothetical protein
MEISSLRSETTPANKPFSPGSSFPPVDSHRPRKYPACVRKLHPRTSLFHPEVLFLRSIRAGRGNIRPAFGNYTREQAFFTRKFFSFGRFAPAAEISGLRLETTPANKPFSPGSSFPPVDSRRSRKYPACVWKLHPRTSPQNPANLTIAPFALARGNNRRLVGNHIPEITRFTRPPIGHHPGFRLENSDFPLHFFQQPDLCSRTVKVLSRPLGVIVNIAR